MNYQEFPGFSTKKMKTVLFLPFQGMKIEDFLKILSLHIKNEIPSFLNHLQQFIKKAPNIGSGPISLKIYCFNQRIHHSDEPWSFRKNDFVTGVH